MSDEFDELDHEPDLEEAVELDDDADDVELDDDLALEDDVLEVDHPPDADEDEDEEAPKPAPAKNKKGSEDDEDVLELDEELHPDDIEDPLDVLLQERTTAASLEDEDEEAVEDIESDERGEAATRIVPRRPGEFLCKSCFLVLPRAQLANEKLMLCRDCA